MLHLYAADLARAPDGRWWVVDDRTQAPSGAGYALENRLVVSRLYSDLFRDLNVQRLAAFFATLRDSLAHWAPAEARRARSPCWSRPGRTTKPISSTPTSRATSAFRWSRATT